MAYKKDNKGRVLKPGFTQRKDGRYCYRYREDGKTISIYDKNLKDLEAKAEKIKDDKKANIKPQKAEKTSLNDMFEIFIEQKRIKDIRESTLLNYIYLYNRFARDEIGKNRLSDITPLMIENFYNKLLKDSLKIGTLRILHYAITASLKIAVKINILRSNPAEDVEIRELRGAKKAEKRHSLTEEEQIAFVEWARKSPDYCVYVPLFITLLGTGMRIGEALGLTWADIDLKNNFIHVNKTLTYKVWEDGRAAFKIHPPKTDAGDRKIMILDNVHNALLEQKKERLRCGMCETVIDGYKDFVFPNSRNHVHKPNTINRVIDSIIKWANKEEEENAKAEGREPMLIRHFSVHNFRHTYATFLCMNGVNPKVAQTLLGHSSIKVTMDVYADITKDAIDETTDMLNKKFRIS